MAEETRQKTEAEAERLKKAGDDFKRHNQLENKKTTDRWAKENGGNTRTMDLELAHSGPDVLFQFLTPDKLKLATAMRVGSGEWRLALNPSDGEIKLANDGFQVAGTRAVLHDPSPRGAWTPDQLRQMGTIIDEKRHGFLKFPPPASMTKQEAQSLLWRWPDEIAQKGHQARVIMADVSDQGGMVDASQLTQEGQLTVFRLERGKAKWKLDVNSHGFYGIIEPKAQASQQTIIIPAARAAEFRTWYSASAFALYLGKNASPSNVILVGDRTNPMSVTAPMFVQIEHTDSRQGIRRLSQQIPVFEEKPGADGKLKRRSMGMVEKEVRDAGDSLLKQHPQAVIRNDGLRR